MNGVGGDVTLLGKALDDAFGQIVGGAGDLNGDGFDDLVVGTPQNDDGASQNAGAAYLLYGAASLSATYQMNGAGVNVTIIGKGANDYLGLNVIGTGDVNEDGIDDLLIGADQNDDGAANGGAAYILLGGSSLAADFDIAGTGVNISIIAKGADRLGRGSWGGGDINGDGFDDAVIGARFNDDSAVDAGAAYFIFGRFFPAAITLDLANAEESVIVTGKGGSDQLGFFSGGAGDVNDDGFFDIIVAGRLNDDGPGGNNDGAAYIIYGSTSLASSIPAGNSDVTFFGKAATDRLGSSVSGIGDVNYDEFPDLLIGAFGNADISTLAGAAYILFGSETISSEIRMDGSGANITVLGKTGYDYFGLVVSGGRGNPGP